MAIKTLHFTNAFHAHSGGISTFYMALLHEADRQEREMRLVVPGEEDREEQVGRYGKIYFLRAHTAPLNSDYRCINPIQYLDPVDALRRILRMERPDVIEICDKYNLHFLSGMIRENLLKDLDFRPVMVGLSCERMDENVAAYLGDSALHRLFCRWYMHWLYFPFFDHHAAVSEHAAAELVAASSCHRVRRGIWIRPMGVDTARFSPARRTVAMRKYLLQHCRANQASILLLYAGRLAPEKNLPLLIEMMQRLLEDNIDYRLLLVGDGIERERLELLAQKLAPGRIFFLEHITDRERLAEIYASCDLFVHPNPREPFGIAPLEAMASGLPLIAANSGGITSFADDSNAWLANPDGPAFAAAVRNAMADEKTRNRKVEAALVTATDNCWDSAACAYFTLYDAIYGQFWGSDLPADCPPYAWSTQGTSFSNAVIQASSVFAQTLCRAAARVATQTRELAPQNSSPRYMHMVPSVTGTEENHRSFCIQEGQT
jgi:alpha-1,6-mannosyltransferase